MGAWDYGSFQNDAASDWAYQLIESKDPVAFLQEALTPEDEDGYLDSYSASQLIAAVENRSFFN